MNPFPTWRKSPFSENVLGDFRGVFIRIVTMGRTPIFAEFSPLETPAEPCLEVLYFTDGTGMDVAKDEAINLVEHRHRSGAWPQCSAWNTKGVQ